MGSAGSGQGEGLNVERGGGEARRGEGALVCRIARELCLFCLVCGFGFRVASRVQCLLLSVLSVSLCGVATPMCACRPEQ